MQNAASNQQAKTTETMPFVRLPPFWLSVLQTLLLSLACLLAAAAFAEEDDDEDELPDLRPGLVARYIGADGVARVRRDEALQFAWGEQPPDARLAPGPFAATWSGRLFTIAPGEYRLHVYAAGKVKLKLAGKTLLDAAADEPRWLAAEPIALEYGYHALEVEYRKTGAAARIGLYWSGPQFQLEPVPKRHLFHEPQAAPDERFAEGQLLARALRCGACHEVPGERPPLSAPALKRLAGNISRDWLIERLQHPLHSSRRAGGATPPVDPAAPNSALARRMPRFKVSADEAASIADYLLDHSEKSQPDTRLPAPASKPTKDAKTKQPKLPDAQAGEMLFDTLGCLACHTQGSLGAAGLFGGGDLSAIAGKRPADFFARWLADPARINPAHRMPVFKLADEERADLTAYLSTLGAPAGGANELHGRGDGGAKRKTGRRLVEAFRCGHCHALPEALDKGAKRLPPIGAQANWRKSCLVRSDGAKHRPTYTLSQAQRDAVEQYFRELPAARRPAPLEGRFVLTERNCLACHARGLTPGIAGHAERVAEAQPELAPILASLAPPALSGVGDKLHEEALAAAISLKQPPLRPWLSVRMPRFDLADDELRALTEHLVASDRIPELPESLTTNEPESAAMSVVGARLVTSEGFGCTSCHQIGKSIPVKVAPAAHGTDLSLVGRRIRRSWYDRWVRNPARIVPRMEMPSIQLPVRGVLGERLDDQLAAVWQALNTPGFDPPQPNPVRVVRARNLPGQSEPAVALSDVLEIEGRPFARPLVAALPNRHNVLVDLDSHRLAAWWIGDAARQRTRGKSWYWESGGAAIVPASATPSDNELVVLRGGKQLESSRLGQFTAELDAFELVPGGVRIEYRLQYLPLPLGEGRGEGGAARDAFSRSKVKSQSLPAHPHPLPKGEGTKTLAVRQTITELRTTDDRRSGFRRRLEIGGAAPGDELRLNVAPGSATIAKVRGKTAILAGAQGDARITLIAPASGKFVQDPAGLWLALSPSGDKPLVCELEYSTDLPVDRYPLPAPNDEPLASAPLDVVPGYEAIRLPLPMSEMPTGLAWRDDGTLAFCSLKGSVWLARDTNGDGLEDEQTLFADGLPAPYGIAAASRAIDVSAKYALVRLTDRDGDGRADRSEIAAADWGYTSDYHDWAVGLPRDREGNYYLGLPCQQDDRSSRAAYLRGNLVQLRPRQPTADNPRRFSIRPIAAGLRFPMGLALDRFGELFCTDNQGNYTPFNELNHVVAGARYGFINKLERTPGFQPPFQPAAIEIPHPWTRSINGICFLDTPTAVRAKLGRDLFGVHEGHLIGCEFDTRRLIRMSLERIGDTYQGAVYPLSIEPAPGGQTFEGPIVAAVAPDGDVYIGNLRDSGWGGGQNTGSLVRLRPRGELPPGIAAVHAVRTGFTIDFAQPLDAAAAADVQNYAVSSYRRLPTPAYGGPDADRENERVEEVVVSPDARRATLKLARLRPGFVYEFRLKQFAPKGLTFFPAEAYYTLRRIPK